MEDEPKTITLRPMKGEWDTVIGSGSYAGTLHSSQTAGNFSIVFFQSPCVSLTFPGDKLHGTLELYIDDVKMATLVQYTPTPTALNQSPAFCVADGIHTLRLVHAAGGVVDIDAVTIQEPPVPVEYDYQYFMPMFPGF